MFKRSFRRHFGSVLDEGKIRDPWSLGFGGPVLREDHEEWQTYLQSIKTRTPLVGSIVKEGARASLKAQIGGDDRPGFRRKRKLSRRQRLKRATDSVDLNQAIDDAIDATPADEMFGVSQDLNVVKAGAALILMRPGWYGVHDEHEEDRPVRMDDLDEKLVFLGWEGVRKGPKPEAGTPWRQAFDDGLELLSGRVLSSEEGQVRLEVRQGQETEIETVELGPEDRVHTGNPHDDEIEGNPLMWVGLFHVCTECDHRVGPIDDEGYEGSTCEACGEGEMMIDEEDEFGDQPVGDALTTWVLFEIGEAKNFRGQYVKAAAENLERTPDSAPGTGTDSG